MENYLLELIRENNRIIIPNFGAFIVSREKEQNILFNSFLSFNDGLLISHICAVEGVDSATAARKVDNYVAQVNSTLDEKGFYEIEGIGRFTKGRQWCFAF
jgi:nucleoid DNA-binding protein